MEPISLGVSLVALTSLFSTCVEYFEYLDAARNLGRECEVLITQFEVEKTRLLIWGESMGLLDKDEKNMCQKLNSPLFRPVIERTLNCIFMLLTDAEQLRSRYGVKESSFCAASRLQMVTSGIGSISLSRFKASYAEFCARTKEAQQKTRVTRKARWAIHDRAKFAKLIEDLRQSIDGLWAITNTPALTEKRAQLINDEVRSIKSTMVLSLLAESTAEKHRDWADVTSEVLEASLLGEDERLRVGEWVDKLTLDQESVKLESLGNEDSGQISEARLDFVNISGQLYEELLTPLNGIQGMVAYSLQENDLGKLRRSLGTIYQATDSIRKVINDVADATLGRLKEVVLEEHLFDLEDLKACVFSMLKDHAAERKIEFTVTSIGKPCQPLSHVDVKSKAVHSNVGRRYTPYFCGDYYRIMQILNVLISNALKFTPENGEVGLRIFHDHDFADQKTGGEDQHEVKTSLDEEKNNVTFEVFDTGCGITPELQTQILESFAKTTTPREEGNGVLGMGLTIVNDLVTRMSGSVYLKSRLGEGNIFQVTIPLKVFWNVPTVLDGIAEENTNEYTND